MIRPPAFRFQSSVKLPRPNCLLLGRRFPKVNREQLREILTQNKRLHTAVITTDISRLDKAANAR
jgi:hypothetical protein